MSLTEGTRRRLIIATASTEAGNEIADSVDGLVITQPLTLYVETTGNDGNSGTADHPFLTIQAAIDYVAQYTLMADVTISVGAGTFGSFTLNTQGNYKQGTTAVLKILGTWTTQDVGGTFTGQSHSTVLTVFTDTSKTWTVNQFADMYVELTLAGSLVYYPIISNTATALTIVTGASSFATLTYRIVSHATIVGSPTIALPGSSANTGVEVFNNCPLDSLTIVEAVSIICGSSGRAINSSSSVSGATFTSCKFTGSIGLVIAVTGGLTFNKCIINGVTSQVGISITTTGRRTRCVSTSETYIKGCTTSISISAPDQHSFLNTYIVGAGGATVGMLLSDSCRCVINVHINSCGTGVLLRNRVCGTNGASGSTLHGTGNTLAIQCDSGSILKLSSSATITGTTEISVDGVTSTIAAMRALTPKIFPAAANAYGSYVFE